MASESVQIIIDGVNRASGPIRQAETRLKSLTDQVTRMSAKMRSLGAGLTAAVTLPILAVGTASIKMAMDAIESENLFEVSMGKMADSARQWSEGLRSQLGLNAFEVRKNVGTFNLMFTAMGVGEKASFDMAKGLTQLSVDMASF